MAGIAFNIDTGLDNRHDFNVLNEPIKDLMNKLVETWQRENPLAMFYTFATMKGFQDTYTSSIGFANAFAETGDYAVAPIFNNHEGFSKVFSNRTFQGGFIVTQELIEDGKTGAINELVTKFTTRWGGGKVEYGITALMAGFGQEVVWGDQSVGGASVIKMDSYDTPDGNIRNPLKNPLFYNKHTIVKRREMSNADIAAMYQSNAYYVTDGAATPTYGLNLLGSDPGMLARLGDVINQVITNMENLRDDNGKYAGVIGAKTIIAPNDARLKAALETVLSLDMFNDMGQKRGLNPAFKRASLETTVYLRDIACCYDKTAGIATGFFIVDKAWMSANKGLEWTTRVPMTMNVAQKRNPYGIAYDGRERFDVNVATWQGIAYVYIGAAAPSFTVTPSGGTAWDNLTPLTTIATLVKPVSIAGPLGANGGVLQATS
jgi:hypothetical protein